LVAHLDPAATAFHAPWLGLHTALVICAVGALLGPLYALSSPLRNLQVQPSDLVDRQISLGSSIIKHRTGQDF